MPINTDLNISPYYDDYSENKNFYRVLFRPGVSVQARELNQLQSIFQKQIERFGDNIFKRGSIIDGCQFTFETSVPYVKIKDTETDGTAVDMASYLDKYVTNITTGHSGHIIDYKTGFESSDPNLNTIYVRYKNSGTTKSRTAFANGDTLRVTDSNNSIFGVTIVSGSSNVANTNSVVFVSAVSVTNSLGGSYFANAFNVGDSVMQTVGAATSNLVITGVDTTTNTNALILKVRPQYASLAASNTAAWTLIESDSSSEWLASNNASPAVGIIKKVIGSGATASLTTDSIIGSIQSIEMLTQGDGYYIAPYVSVSGAASGPTANVNMVARNYTAEITVAENLTSSPIGFGYAFGVSDGVIYQKGYFSRVSKQRIIVEKYSKTPDQKVVGFDTQESIVNSNIDATLLDNATGTYNYNAPGANRLVLEPNLVVLSKTDASANDEFFSIVEWSEGQPFKQNRNTTFNSIQNELAERTFDESGNYVLDTFYLYTKSPAVFANEASNFKIVIDPGVAYIGGRKVETIANYSKSIVKGKTANTDTKIRSNTAISVNYGNYIKIKELGGVFKFNIGEDISLRISPKNYLTSGGFAAPSANGAEIGKARIRSLVYDSGEPGSPSAVYRLYLFDINMNAGYNFKDVKSVFYDSTVDAVADIVLGVDGTGNSVATIFETGKNTLLSYSGVDALKTATSLTYTYRTVNNSLTMNSSSIFTLSNAAGESWPYTSTLSTNEKEDIIIVPTANAFAAANAAGSASFAGTGANLVGTSTTFVADYTVGDYIFVGNSSVNTIQRITSIVNNTLLICDSNGAFACTTANTKLAFPQYAPIPFSTRNDRTASVAGSVLTVNLNKTLSSTVAVTASYNMKTTSKVDKTVKRKRYVKIRPANNSANVSANAAGSVSAGATSTTLTGTSTAFTTAFIPGDYIAIWANSTHYNLRQISTITNNTVLTLSSNAFVTNTSANVAKINSVNLTPGLDDPWCLGVPDIFRLRGVYVSNVATVNTTNGTNVTDNFYIDHNQSENSYDLGFLFKKPNSNLTFTSATNNDFDKYYLVEFDMFTSSGQGIKYIDSYPLNDTSRITTLDATPESSAINTVEISEVYGTRGSSNTVSTYYDLRDQFDFRPYATATATVANSSTYAASAPVNPIDSVFATKFDSTDKKFPAPESDIFATIENYLGRTDAAAITSNGDFIVVKGTPGTSKLPETPKNSILINYLQIPPYPSIPAVIGSGLAEFLDTNIANENYSKTRYTKYQIKTPLSETNIARQQPRGYTMEDIGNLERRIADLEYYSSLSFVEDTVKNTNIFSSVDPTVERYKFGYFIDNFSTTDFSDFNNPQFQSTIFNYELGPKKGQLNLEFVFDTAATTQELVTGTVATLPFTSYTLIQQLNATDGPVVPPPPPANNGGGNTGGGGGNVVVNTVITAIFTDTNFNWQRAEKQGWEYKTLQFANAAGVAAWFFDSNNGNSWYWVRQKSTPIPQPSDYNADMVSLNDYGNTIASSALTGAAGPQSLTTADRQYLESHNILHQNLDGKYGRYNTSWANRPGLTIVGDNSLGGCGKLEWTHDPTKGNYYLFGRYKNPGKQPVSSIKFPSSTVVTTTQQNAAQVAVTKAAETPTTYAAAVVPNTWGELEASIMAIMSGKTDLTKATKAAAPPADRDSRRPSPKPKPNNHNKS